jgi:hypothetical protein
VRYLNIAAAWERPEDDQANIDWARNAWRDLRQFSTGGTYIKLPDGRRRRRPARARHTGRIILAWRSSKRSGTSDNLFRTNKNIDGRTWCERSSAARRAMARSGPPEPPSIFIGRQSRARLEPAAGRDS